MADPKGTFIVTGCNRGLGLAVASVFLNSSSADIYRGVFGVRKPAEAPDLQSVIARSPTSRNHEAAQIDLSTIESVRTSAKRINDRVRAGTLPPIRALVLNAAMQNVTSQVFTNDGLEQTFAVNYLANFLFTLLLLPSMDKKDGRVVIVSSWTHDVSHPLNGFIVDESHKTIVKDLNDWAKPKADKPGDDYNAGMRRYGTSKAFMIMFMYEFQRRLSATPELANISVLAVDPGAMPGTGLLRDSSAALRFAVHWLVGAMTPLLCWWSPNGYFRTAHKSATDLYNASFDEAQLSKYPKGLYLNGSDLAQSSPETKDEAKQKRLWDYSVQLTGLKPAETVVKLA